MSKYIICILALWIVFPGINGQSLDGFSLNSKSHYNPYAITGEWHIQADKNDLAADEYLAFYFRLVDLLTEKEYRWNSTFELARDSGTIYCFVPTSRSAAANDAIELHTLADNIKAYAAWQDLQEGCKIYSTSPQAHIFKFPGRNFNFFQLISRKEFNLSWEKEFLLLEIGNPDRIDRDMIDLGGVLGSPRKEQTHFKLWLTVKLLKKSP